MITVKVVMRCSNYRDSRKTFNCPHCGEIASFYSYQDRICRGEKCLKALPNIKALIETPEGRLGWYAGGLE